MTTKGLSNLKPGTSVVWTATGHECSGIVTRRPDMNHDAPHYMIDWADGQQTDGRDDAALEYVKVKR